MGADSGIPFSSIGSINGSFTGSITIKNGKWTIDNSENVKIVFIHMNYSVYNYYIFIDANKEVAYRNGNIYDYLIVSREDNNLTFVNSDGIGSWSVVNCTCLY